MNSYEEFNSKKYLIMILLICVVFLILIIRAFSYLPDSSKSNNVTSNNIAQADLLDRKVSEETKSIESNDESDNQVSSNELKVSLPVSDKITEIEDNSTERKVENELPSIDTEITNTEEKTQELSPEEQAEQILIQAAKYKKDKQYVKALEEYNKVSTVTKDTYYVAKSYEEIATIYAIVKRYGSALSFAQKAYNMSPSSSREMLLARLYYKTGDIDKATQRVNNVLQRDFAADR